jgi:F-type H+-transporting ATPase subunit b
MVNFLVAIFVLNLVLVRPIRRILKERREHAHSFIEESEKFNNTADTRLKNYEEELATARNKAAEQKERIRQQAFDTEQSILGAAQNEAMSILQKSRKDVEREVGDASAVLRAQIGTLSGKVVTRLLS